MTHPTRAVYFRCPSCPTTGIGDGAADRHRRAKKHPTETTTRRDLFARWQAEAERGVRA